MKNNSPYIGFIYGIIAAFCHAIMAVFIKLSSDFPTAMIVFFRGIICLFFVWVIFFRSKSFSIRTEKGFLHLMRSVIGLSGMYCFVYASKKLCLVDNVMLMNTTPLFIPLVILIWFRYKIPFNRVVALVVGFFGVILILKPGLSFFNFSGLIGLCSGLFIGTAFVFVKELSKTEPTERILFYFFSGSILFSIIPLLATWKPIHNPVLWIYLIMSSIGAFGFQFFITKAYTYAPATRVSCLGYCSILFSGIFDRFVYKTIPDLLSIVGIIMVICAGIYIILNKKEGVSTKKVEI